MGTLTAVLNNQHQNLIQYDKMLSGNMATLEEIGKLTPYIFHCNDADFNFKFLNEKGCGWFCMASECIISMGKDFVDKYYHPDTIKLDLPLKKHFNKNKDFDTVYSTFQQIYNPSIQAYSMCLVFIKRCSFLSGFVSITHPIEKSLSISKTMGRIISEEIFKENHVQYYNQLTHREQQILKMLAEGLNNPQISEQLYISRRTVEQHRKNINRKLNVQNYKDIISYAYAFDLM